jgi:hypothetical protein
MRGRGYPPIGPDFAEFDDIVEAILRRDAVYREDPAVTRAENRGMNINLSRAMLEAWARRKLRERERF